MRAYKHWEKQWAEDLTERGRLRLMPLTHYHQTFERVGVQDHLENVAHVRQRGDIVARGFVGDADRAALERVGIHVDGNVRGLVAVGNQAVWRGENVYVFCLTRVAEPGLFKDNDIVTFIPSVARFAGALLEASKGKFRGYAQHRVRYDWQVQFAEDARFRGPEPFRKRPEFQYQQEVRITLYPQLPLSGAVYLESPLLRRALEL